MEFVQGASPQTLTGPLARHPANTPPDYVTLLPRLLPPSVASPLLTFVTTAFGIFRTIQTHLTPLFSRVVTQPDVASILALVAIFFISLKILDMMYRAVLFWVNMVIRLALWGSMAVLGLWVYNRGIDGFVRDVQDIAQTWMGSYEKYSNEVKRYQAEKEGQIRMQAAQQAAQQGKAW
jgi:hypothetical protein